METLPQFLARLGKTELKPGGTFATGRLIQRLELSGAKELMLVGPSASNTGLFVSMTTQARTVALVKDERENITEHDPTLSRRSTARVGKPEKLPFDDATFDAVMIEATLAHCPPYQRPRILAEAFRVLKPGGLIGLHEFCWRQPPTLEVELRLNYVWGEDVHPLVVREWWDLLEGAEFEDVRHELAVVSYFTRQGLEADEGHETTVNLFHSALGDANATERFVQAYREFATNRRYYGVIIATAKKVGG
jgi:SAM-dependent methyltransferase